MPHRTYRLMLHSPGLLLPGAILLPLGTAETARRQTSEELGPTPRPPHMPRMRGFCLRVASRSSPGQRRPRGKYRSYGVELPFPARKTLPANFLAGIERRPERTNCRVPPGSTGSPHLRLQLLALRPALPYPGRWRATMPNEPGRRANWDSIAKTPRTRTLRPPTFVLGSSNRRDHDGRHRHFWIGDLVQSPCDVRRWLRSVFQDRGGPFLMWCTPGSVWGPARSPCDTRRSLRQAGYWKAEHKPRYCEQALCLD